MYYRVTADYPFTNEDEARDFFHDCLVAYPKTAVINQGAPTEEKPAATLHICHHDEEGFGTCELVLETPTPSP